MLRHPPAKRPAIHRTYASPTEAFSLSELLQQKKSPFVQGGKAGESLEGVNRRLAIATITGMADKAARDAGLPGGHLPVELKGPGADGDGRAFLWASDGDKPNYGMVMRPGYLGAPRGLDATVRHEAAHAADLFRKDRSKQSHGPTFREEEERQYVPNLKLRPEYGGNDYEGQNEYADRYAEVPTDKRYKDHVYLSDYDDARQRVKRVNMDALKGALKKNKKAYVQHLKMPPVVTNRTGPAVRGL